MKITDYMLARFDAYLKELDMDPILDSAEGFILCARNSEGEFLAGGDMPLRDVTKNARRLLSAYYSEDEPRDEPEDSPTVANCDDWGTGEGKYHGRI